MPCETRAEMVGGLHLPVGVDDPARRVELGQILREVGMGLPSIGSAKEGVPPVRREIVRLRDAYEALSVQRIHVSPEK